jgi:hypothetical protein
MKMFELTKRHIAPVIVVCCFVCCCFAPVAFSQTPKSGALLTINGSGASSGVSIFLYDSQIHSGTAQISPCDGIPTDAYVLQGGSSSGCDNGDAYEVTDNNGNPVHQKFGQTDVTLSAGPGSASLPGTGFHIETHYIEAPAVCNTSLTICAGPDTGFLTVTNNTGSAFTGTITLQGTSPISGGFCPATGTVSDSATFPAGIPLANGGAVTLALSTDSSNCGGFNATQSGNLGGSVTFFFGNEDLTITPFIGASASDTLTFLPVPIPAGPLGSATFTGFAPGKYGTETPLSSPVRFGPATNFLSQACIAWDDFSALGNPVCADLQVDCSGPDCDNFIYKAKVDFTKDHNSLTTIGGTEFLKLHTSECPTNAFDQNIFFSYMPTSPDPMFGGGLGNSCQAMTFDPTAAPVAVGSTLTQKTFVGFQDPVVNCTGIFPAACGTINNVNSGKSIPLIWQTFSDPAGTVPVNNLSFCGNTAGTGCTPPWVFVGWTPVFCASDVSTTGTVLADTPGASGFQNLGMLGLAPLGTYQYNWKTNPGQQVPGTCATPVLGSSGGFWWFDVAEMKFK